MKNKILIVGTSIGTGFLFVVSIIIQILFGGKSWAIVWGTFIGLAFTWLVVGVIILWRRLNAEEQVQKRISSKDAISKEIEAIKEDGHNPDNIIIKNQNLWNLGAEGYDKTPILILDCWGTELGQRRISIINLEDHKNPTRLTNPKEKEFLEAVRLRAEIPEGKPITEEIKSFFEHGMPTTIKKTTSPSPSIVRQKEEEKKLEEKAGL